MALMGEVVAAIEVRYCTTAEAVLFWGVAGGIGGCLVRLYKPEMLATSFLLC